ncbi:MAG: hypothetical protein ACM31L_02030 [Actinomycetota bacterium]
MAGQSGTGVVADGRTDLDVIRDALRSDVVDILKAEIEHLQALGRHEAYDAILGEPTLLAQSFAVFRTRPELFREVVVDSQSRPVTADDDQLQCGRRLSEVVTLVVRASARRYFRTRLKPPPARVAKPAPKGIWQRLTALWAPEPAAAKAVPAGPSPGERLYQAMRQHLVFDWQAAMLPHYVPIPVRVVEKLGARLLDIQEPAELHAVTSHVASGTEPDRTPLLLDRAKRLMVPNSETIDADVLWKVCQQMDLKRLFPGMTAEDLQTVVSLVAAVRPATVALIMPVLGHDIRRFTAFLMVAYATLGPQRFRHTFAQPDRTLEVRRWMAYLATHKEPPPRLDAMKALYRRVLTSGVETQEAAPAPKPQQAKAPTVNAPKGVARPKSVAVPFVLGVGKAAATA